MAPQATSNNAPATNGRTRRRPSSGGNNAASANTSSTLNADGGGAAPKRKRTRGRGGRGRGGRGKAADSSDDDSSSSDDDSSDVDADEPVASTSKLTPSTTETSKSKTATPTDKKSSSSNGKAKAQGEDVEAEDSDDDSGNSSDASSSSSSSFLTTSEEDEVAPTARQAGRKQQQQHDSAMAGSAYDGGFNGTMADPGAVEASQQANKRPEMTRPPTPPYIQFGADADAVHNVRAFGKPILWGLLPSDVPSKDIPTPISASTEESEDRTSAMIKEEQAAAESRYTRFREDYVSKMITRFGGSLDAIRQKEADTMTESRLQVLIASIAGGADNFTSKDGKGIWKTSSSKGQSITGERELALEALDALVPREMDGDVSMQD